LTTALAKKIELIERGRLALAQAKSVADAKQIRDQAAAIEYYLRQQLGAQDASLYAAELKVRSERRLGELLGEQKPKQSRPRLHDGTLGNGKTLPPEVTKVQSHRWQKVAKVPEDKFEQYVANAVANKERADLTTTGILRIAKEQEREAKREAVKAYHDSDALRCAIPTCDSARAGGK
jgi:hypothetical protein